MLAILDPALFWVSGTDTPLSQEEEETLRVHLDNANRIIKQYRCDIPTPDWYWRKLQLEMVKPLSLRLRGPHVKRALAELCRCPPSSHNEEPQVPASVRMWHVKPLFQCRYLSDTWIPIMEQLLLYCINKKEKIIFIARYLENRNLKTHLVNRCELREKKRWRLYVHASGFPPIHIPSVQEPRNLAVVWTARFDEQLPDTGPFPFCPPENWWRSDVQSLRTISSKPAWIDKRGSGWARPSTGGGYHWDVYIEDSGLREHVGLDQINVVQFGAPSKEGIPGSIHHVPTEKRSFLNERASWKCD